MTTITVTLPEHKFFSREYLETQLRNITTADRTGRANQMRDELSTAFDSLFVVYLAMCHAQGVTPRDDDFFSTDVRKNWGNR